MGDPRSILDCSSASMDGSCVWTEISASNARHASLNKKHLDFLPIFDRSVVSVGRQIGEGGQGRIYEAKLHVPYSFKPFPVVVKKFKPFEGVSQGHFPQEMVSLKSYNLCLPLGVFFEGDSLSIMMSRYTCDLRAAIDSRLKVSQDEVLGADRPPFSEMEGRFIILQLAMGLKALHECGVYHRDLKAANVLVSTFGKNCGTSSSRPAHLGIADFERSEGVVGTGFWRAPEVLQSLLTDIPLSKEQWLLADVYSFGMLCYEVLTGMIPFHDHRLSDYGLVINGRRPEIPNHVPQYWKDLISRCWDADPHSRPNWSEIIEVLVHHDDALFPDKVQGYVDNLVSVESLSSESLIHESKQLVRDLTALHEGDSRSFRSEFMPYYWASEFLPTATKYASKMEAELHSEEGPVMCNVQRFFDWVTVLLMLRHQGNGVGFGFFQFFDLVLEQEADLAAYVEETVYRRERLQGMVATIFQRGCLDLKKIKCTGEFEAGTSWRGKLFFFHALLKWVLWYEHVGDGWEREFMMKRLLPPHWSVNSIIDTLLILFCMVVNAYIYVLAMITWEPILLGLQYRLYKTKGCNNILYQSFGERICRFQRAWLNCTRYKVVSTFLSLSFVTFLVVYGWKGVLGWILIPCVIIFTPYWQQPIIKEW